MPDSNLHKLSALGQSVWIDYLSRQMLKSGKLARMMEEDAVVGVTSNPTIFQKAIAEGDAYDEQLKEILETDEEDPKEIFLQLSSHDISDACDLLRKVWDEGEGLDGYVSWEVDPTLAYDREGTIAQAKRLHDWIDKPNLYVKIPATKPGLGAIEADRTDVLFKLRSAASLHRIMPGVMRTRRQLIHIQLAFRGEEHFDSDQSDHVQGFGDPHSHALCLLDNFPGNTSGHDRHMQDILAMNILRWRGKRRSPPRHCVQRSPRSPW